MESNSLSVSSLSNDDDTGNEDEQELQEEKPTQNPKRIPMARVDKNVFIL
jgi:hypothetical protein